MGNRMNEMKLRIYTASDILKILSKLHELLGECNIKELLFTHNIFQISREV